MAEQELRRTGTVKWFSASRGFGFITPNEGEEELFVHQSTIRAEGFRSLREGEIVEFDLERGEDGRNRAVNVTGPRGLPPLGSQPVPRYPSYHYGYPIPGEYYPQHIPGPDGIPRPYPGYYMYYGSPQGNGYGGGMLPVMRPVGSTPSPRSPNMPRRSASAGSSGYQVVVQNLPWACTWQRLKEVFNQWEVVRADVIVNQYGQSRGFGVVRFASESDASAAIASMNGTEMDGREITVKLDRYA